MAVRRNLFGRHVRQLIRALLREDDGEDCVRTAARLVHVRRRHSPSALARFLVRNAFSSSMKIYYSIIIYVKVDCANVMRVFYDSKRS